MKLNYLYCLLAFLLMPLCIKAQDVKYLKYQGEVNTSFSFSIDEETSNLNLEVINGVRFSRYFFAGAGIGATASFSDEAIFFSDFRGPQGIYACLEKNGFDGGCGCRHKTGLHLRHDWRIPVQA